MVTKETICDNSIEHNNARGLKDLRNKIYVKQEKIDITIESLRKIKCRIPNWKSRGPNLC